MELHDWPLAVQRLPVQQPPAEHSPPGQHGWLGPPHVWQKPLLQMVPASGLLLHWLPAQQGWLGPPQAVQVELPLEVVHAKPVWQVLPWQQRWPLPPHVAQTGLVDVPVQAPASQAPPRQHGSPMAPQARHMPAEHTPWSQRLFAQHCWLSPPQGVHWFVPVQLRPTSQVEPEARQTLLFGSLTSQQPVLHWSFAQHGWLAPPQPEQAPVARQRSPPKHTAFVARQRLARSQQPPLHTLPAQHGVPGVPQAVQVRPEQTVCGWLQNWF
jgi:hypothetical protein